MTKKRSNWKDTLRKVGAPLAVALVVPGGSLLVAVAWLVKRGQDKEREGA